MTPEEAIKNVWEYHQLGQDLVPADMIWALGSHDLRVADRVAELWHLGLAPLVVMSGGLGNFTEGVFEKPEADLFAERARELGVPDEVLLIENRSTNCGENVAYTRALLADKQIAPVTAIAVQKPYMERRTFATIRKQWPELHVRVTSPQLSFADYCGTWIAPGEVVTIMVGDLERIWEYPKRGFMIEQEIPDSVKRAWDLLVKAGYDGHLLGAAPASPRDESRS